MAMKGKSRTQPQQQLEPKNYENSTCSKTNSPLASVAGAPSHRTGAGHANRVDGRTGPGNAQLRSYNQQPFIPWTTCRHCARRSLSGSRARFDVQGSPDVVAPHDGAWRFGRLCHPKHVSARGSQWVAHASGSQPDHRHIWSAHSLRGLGPHLYAHNLHGRPELHRHRLRGRTPDS
jgi:hypothetical protein